MICFFTSSPCLVDSSDLNPANGFIHELHLALPYPCRTVYLCSDPDCPDETDQSAVEIGEAMERAGFAFDFFEVLDGRNANQAASLLKKAQFLVLSGGHVPTQNSFFRSIRLKRRLKGFDGVIMGISAGSMNSAETVYAHPELPGEAVDPAYRRFLPGLGLTKRNIIPHYNSIQGGELDGLDLFEDIAIPDSMGRTFYVLPDGSYILSRGGEEILHGEAYSICDGVMEQISGEEDTVPLQ